MRSKCWCKQRVTGLWYAKHSPTQRLPRQVEPKAFKESFLSLRVSIWLAEIQFFSSTSITTSSCNMNELPRGFACHGRRFWRYYPQALRHASMTFSKQHIAYTISSIPETSRIVSCRYIDLWLMRLVWPSLLISATWLQCRNAGNKRTITPTAILNPRTFSSLSFSSSKIIFSRPFSTMSSSEVTSKARTSSTPIDDGLASYDDANVLGNSRESSEHHRSTDVQVQWRWDISKSCVAISRWLKSLVPKPIKYGSKIPVLMWAGIAFSIKDVWAFQFMAAGVLHCCYVVDPASQMPSFWLVRCMIVFFFLAHLSIWTCCPLNTQLHPWSQYHAEWAVVK